MTTPDEAETERHRREALPPDVQVTLDLAEGDGCDVYVSGHGVVTSVHIQHSTFSDELVLRLWRGRFSMGHHENDAGDATSYALCTFVRGVRVKDGE